jgi:hypothetical protein
MRKLLLILASLAGTVLAQTPMPQPEVPMVPAVRPPLRAASRAMRHEVLAHEQRLRLEEKAEDRADAEQNSKDERRKFGCIER